LLLHLGFTGDMWPPWQLFCPRPYVIVPTCAAWVCRSPDTGYNKKNQAVDIAGVMDALKVKKADLSHMTSQYGGYALAAQISVRVTRWWYRCPLPESATGTTSLQPDAVALRFPGPDEERLVQGRERIYLDRSGTSCLRPRDDENTPALCCL